MASHKHNPPRAFGAPLVPADEPQAGDNASTDAEAAPKTSLNKRVRRGTAVSVGGQLSINVVQLGSNLILTRLLLPEAFGLMAIVNFVVDALQQVSSIGIQPAVVRSKNGAESRFIHTAWAIQALRGALIFVLGLGLAYPLSIFYDDGRLVGLMAAASAGVLLLGFQSIHWATTARALQLERTMGIQVAARVFAATVTIAFAYYTRDVWSIVIGVIAGNILRIVLSHAILPGEKFRLEWHPESAREILHFGKWILVSTFLSFVAIRLDVALLGRMIPFEVLGVYSVGVLVPNIVRQVASIGIQRVLMPALAEVHRSTHATLEDALNTSRQILLPVGTLLIVGCVAAAPAFFTLLYDDRYADAAWIAQLATLALWFDFLQDSSGRALLVLGHSRAWAAVVGVRTIGTLTGAIAGFAVAELPGVLIGIGLGSASGYLALCVALRREKLHIFLRDTAQGAITLAAALAIGMSPRFLPEMPVPDALVTLGFSLLILLPAAGLTLRRILSISRGTSS